MELLCVDFFLFQSSSDIFFFGTAKANIHYMLLPKATDEQEKMSPNSVPGMSRCTPELFWAFMRGGETRDEHHSLSSSSPFDPHELITYHLEY